MRMHGISTQMPRPHSQQHTSGGQNRENSLFRQKANTVQMELIDVNQI